jgi:hypothetical protein
LCLLQAFSVNLEVLHMKVLVSRSRYYRDYQKILYVVKSLDIDLLVAGGCRGADTLAVRGHAICIFTYCVITMLPFFPG